MSQVLPSTERVFERRFERVIPLNWRESIDTMQLKQKAGGLPLECVLSTSIARSATTVYMIGGERAGATAVFRTQRGLQSLDLHASFWNQMRCFFLHRRQPERSVSKRLGVGVGAVGLGQHDVIIARLDLLPRVR